MGYKDVGKFYQEVLSVELSEKSIEKLKSVEDENEYRTFIRDEILPLAKAHGYNISVEDIITYGKNYIQNLSDEELADVVGGVSFKTISSALMSAFMLVTSNSFSYADPPKKENPGKVNVGNLDGKNRPLQQLSSVETAREIEAQSRQVEGKKNDIPADQSKKSAKKQPTEKEERLPVRRRISDYEEKTRRIAESVKASLVKRSTKSSNEKTEVPKTVPTSVSPIFSVPKQREQKVDQPNTSSSVDMGTRVSAAAVEEKQDKHDKSVDISASKVDMATSLRANTGLEETKADVKPEASIVDKKEKHEDGELAVVSVVDETPEHKELSQGVRKKKLASKDIVKRQSKTQSSLLDDTSSDDEESKTVLGDDKTEEKLSPEVIGEKQSESDDEDDSSISVQDLFFSQSGSGDVEPKSSTYSSGTSSLVGGDASVSLPLSVTTQDSAHVRHYDMISRIQEASEENRKVLNEVDKLAKGNLQRRGKIIDKLKKLLGSLSEQSALKPLISKFDLEGKFDKIENANREYEKLIEIFRIYISLSDLGETGSVVRKTDFKKSKREGIAVKKSLKGMEVAWPRMIEWLEEEISVSDTLEFDEQVVSIVTSASAPLEELSNTMSEIIQRYEKRNGDLRKMFSKLDAVDVSMLSKVQLPEVNLFSDTSVEDSTLKLSDLRYDTLSVKGKTLLKQIQIFNNITNWLINYCTDCRKVLINESLTDEEKDFLKKLVDNREFSVRGVSFGLLGVQGQIHKIQQNVKMKLANLFRSEKSIFWAVQSSRKVTFDDFRSEFYRQLNVLRGYVERFKGTDNYENLAADMSKLAELKDLHFSDKVAGIKIEPNIAVLRRSLKFYCDYITGFKKMLLDPLRQVCVCFNPGALMTKIDLIEDLIDTFENLNIKVQNAKNTEEVLDLKEWKLLFVKLSDLMSSRKYKESDLDQQYVLNQLTGMESDPEALIMQTIIHTNMVLEVIAKQLYKVKLQKEKAIEKEAVDASATGDDVVSTVNMSSIMGSVKELIGVRLFDNIDKIEAYMQVDTVDAKVIGEKIEAIEKFRKVISKILTDYNASARSVDVTSIYNDIFIWLKIYGT